MKKLIRCEFGIDTVCVERKYSDGSVKTISISGDCNGGKADSKE